MNSCQEIFERPFVVKCCGPEEAEKLRSSARSAGCQVYESRWDKVLDKETLLHELLDATRVPISAGDMINWDNSADLLWSELASREGRQCALFIVGVWELFRRDTQLGCDACEMLYDLASALAGARNDGTYHCVILRVIVVTQ
jgi:hypothetical protein